MDDVGGKSVYIWLVEHFTDVALPFQSVQLLGPIWVTIRLTTLIVWFLTEYLFQDKDGVMCISAAALP